MSYSNYDFHESNKHRIEPVTVSSVDGVRWRIPNFVVVVAAVVVRGLGWDRVGWATWADVARLRGLGGFGCCSVAFLFG